MKKLKTGKITSNSNLMGVSRWELKKVLSRNKLKPLFGFNKIKMPGNGMLPVSEEAAGEDI